MSFRVKARIVTVASKVCPQLLGLCPSPSAPATLASLLFLFLKHMKTRHSHFRGPSCFLCLQPPCLVASPNSFTCAKPLVNVTALMNICVYTAPLGHHHSPDAPSSISPLFLVFLCNTSHLLKYPTARLRMVPTRY